MRWVAHMFNYLGLLQCLGLSAYRTPHSLMAPLDTTFIPYTLLAISRPRWSLTPETGMVSVPERLYTRACGHKAFLSSGNFGNNWLKGYKYSNLSSYILLIKLPLLGLFCTWDSVGWFSTSALLTLWTRQYFALGDCSEHGRMFSNIPVLYPLAASSTLPVLVATKNVSRHCQMSPGTQNCLWPRTTGYKG